MGKLTKRQAAALEWLPSDGSWRTKAGNMAMALNSLSLRSGPRLVEHEWRLSGPRGGIQSCYRLTPAGAVVKVGGETA